ncbi:hypothetical protein [Picrophilus oshimae]|uniref:Hypothetical membrane spanning protein n=1 Tax=Picrophilus torridus (strain ATCC 700027 / DSM 9790 / JCM 10055 / NBRC 100828 / KAW 2/3) TaxID=1122961 RepID=Q6L2L5_PICTO|nr:hypothetical protein [Picrophilus oshimae]AAT42787.1 hypothetical membrane spanning protein [Picrophilus oshimae DSM 9789]
MRLNLYLSKLLVIEQRYRAIKDSPRYQSRLSVSRIKNTILLYYISNSLSFLFFSIVLNGIYYVKGNTNDISSFGIILFMYIFVIGIYSSLTYINGISINNLLSPVRSLPIKVNTDVPFLSWFIYTGSSYIFIIIPSLLFYYFLVHNLNTIILGLIYAFAMLLFGFIITAIAFIYSSRKPRAHTSLNNFLRILLIFVFLGFFYLIIYDPNILRAYSIYISSLPVYIKYIAFPLNIDYAVYFHPDIIATFFEYLSSFIILLIFFFIYKKIRSRLFYSLEYSEEVKSTEVTRTKIKRDSISVSFIKKDIKITARKSQNLTYILMPIIFVLPFLFTIISSRQPFLSLMFSILSLSILISSFYPIFTLIIENNGILIINALPINRKDIAKYKAYFSMIFYSIIITVVSIIIMAYKNIFNLYYVFIIPDLILIFYTAMIINLNRLIKKIPKGASTINYYSFGVFPTIVLFIVSGIIFGLLISPGIIISEFLYHSIKMSFIFDIIPDLIIFLIMIKK